jgi:hypothetical protein
MDLLIGMRTKYAGKLFGISFREELFEEIAQVVSKDETRQHVALGLRDCLMK